MDDDYNRLMFGILKGEYSEGEEMNLVNAAEGKIKRYRSLA